MTRRMAQTLGKRCMALTCTFLKKQRLNDIMPQLNSPATGEQDRNGPSIGSSGSLGMAARFIPTGGVTSADDMMK